MDTINISVSGVTASAQVPIPIVAGTVGMKVSFCFDPSWDGLEKTAVFRVGGRTMDALLTQQEAQIPWELLKKTGCHLFVGVYGINNSGTLQIPTLWADLGAIQAGADPSGDESADPTLPIWQQLTQDVEEGLQAIIRLEEKMINGEVLPVK